MYKPILCLMPYVPNSDTRNRRPWRGAKLPVCALAFTLVACGDSPPAPRGQGPWSYWSTDMSPVKITFKRVDPVPGEKLPPDMVVPRAYIKYAFLQMADTENDAGRGDGCSGRQSDPV